MQLNDRQRKTTIFLLVWAMLQLVMAMALALWEFIAINAGGHSTITETTMVLYSEEQWPFLLTGVIVTGVIAFICGHIFGAPSQTYEDIRTKGGLQ